VLLIAILALGAIMAATLGVILGAYLNDINSLFATIKSMGILLYAPALVYLFPEIPQWIGRIFPTYYMIQPVISITQQGGSWADVRLDLGVLVIMIVLLIFAAAVVARRLARNLD
jgi:ABC-2 type transport system permease protein